MESEEAHLLTAIMNNPDDDTARLVYADWLDEHGEADRAAFIRLHILGPRAAALDGNPNEALDRVRDLVPAALEAFAQTAPDELGMFFRRRNHYQRGMLSRLTLEQDETDLLTRRLGELLAIAPVTAVDARAEAVSLATFVQQPACGRLRDLTLMITSGNPEVLISVLLESLHLDGLRMLKIRELSHDYDGDKLEYALTPYTKERLLMKFAALPHLDLG